jgi:hypothetical protein
LLSIPKAQDAMTSVVNLAIVSFTSTVEPDNNPRYCKCQDFHFLILKFQQTLTLSLSSQTFLATIVIERKLYKQTSIDATGLPKRFHQHCVV